MTPEEVAIDFIKPYVLRGDDINRFRKEWGGKYCSDYRVQVGAYVNGRKYPNTRIVVEKVNGVACEEVFDLKILWERLLRERNQLSLF